MLVQLGVEVCLTTQQSHFLVVLTHYFLQLFRKPKEMKKVKTRKGEMRLIKKRMNLLPSNQVVTNLRTIFQGSLTNQLSLKLTQSLLRRALTQKSSM